MNNLRFLFVSGLILGVVWSANAQQDTTEYLFKKAKYSYIQYSIGYSPMLFSNGQTAHGFNGELIGVVLNDKIALGLDVDGFVMNTQPVLTSFPTITSLVYMSLNIEPLIRPRKVINFSFPFKIGYGGASVYEFVPQGNYTVLRNPEFMVVSPGAMAWVNLFKPLSLGVGGCYRMTFNHDSSTFEEFSGFSGYATLRFKFYTKEWQQKMVEQQRMYYEQHPRN